MPSPKTLEIREHLSSTWREFREAFLFQLFPSPCVVCESWQGGLRDHLCPACAFRLTQVCAVAERACGGCGEPNPSLLEAFCADCLAHPPPFASMRALHAYGGAIQKLILAFKFGRKRRLAGTLGRMLISVPRPSWSWPEISAIVPVPMHRERFLERGFDHTLLMARALSRTLRRELYLCIPVETGLIEVLRPLTPQVGKERGARLQNLTQALGPGGAKSKRLHTGSILLLDDVFTTGATARACAQVLSTLYSQATLHVLTVARTALSL